jgi:hypothetical protein
MRLKDPEIKSKSFTAGVVNIHNMTHTTSWRCFHQEKLASSLLLSSYYHVTVA